MDFIFRDRTGAIRTLNNNIDYNQLLRITRKRLNLSLQQTADYLGVTRQAVSLWEKGRGNITSLVGSKVH
jgi:DNA-binding transcriptional regulator YiaG